MSKRHELKKEYGVLYNEISDILFKSDLIGINFGDNIDEYEAEVDTILPRLKNCNSVKDIRKVVHEEFTRWFCKEVAGTEEDYDEIARRIWSSWQQYLSKNA